jgi:tellurite resistance protein
VRQVTCARCQAAIPIGAAFALGSRAYCEACARDESASADPHDGSLGPILALADPTVCGRCGTDWGSTELPAVAGIPMCAPCTEAVRARPFPRWLPLSLAVLALLAALSLWHQRRFILGYAEVVRAQRALTRSDLAAATREYEAAARHVPEDATLAATAAFFHGLSLLQAEKEAEAVPLLKRAHSAYPRDKRIEGILRQAEAGAAFEARDYSLFLEKEKAGAALDPRDPMAAAGVASALACQYAVSGDEASKSAALAQLRKASALAKGDRAAFEEYEARILHRLETREIISRAEYLRRFPSGRPQ